MKGKKIVIVGGVAGGASVAARARRIDEQAEIIMIEKGPHVSFSNCCLPYYLSDTIADSDDLVLSPGACPILPKSIEGIDAENVFAVRNVVDIVGLRQYIEQKDAKQMVVVGGGFIGIGVAENLKLAGKQVTLVEAADQVMAPFDYDMAQILHKELVDQGIDLIVEDGVKKIDSDKVILSSGMEKPADAVVIAIGVLPETTLAKDAGLEIGKTGGRPYLWYASS